MSVPTRRLFPWLVLLLLGLVLCAGTAAARDPQVYLVPVHGTIDMGLPGTVNRAIRLARNSGADLLVVEVNTLGGRVDAALAIRDALLACPLPTVVLVKDRAWSAGALIALAADYLYLQPGSSIGAAEPQPADEKTISALRTEFETTAEHHGRDARLAAAMVDRSIAIAGVVEEGRILTLTAQRAVELGLADGFARDLAEVLELQQLESATVVNIIPTAGEGLARFITDPVVAGLLLALGWIGIMFEITSPGFGLPGAVGLACLALFFGGHLLAGIGGWEAAALFLLGIGLLGVEVFLPGFGIFGIAGALTMLGSIYLFTGGGTNALTAISVAMVVTVAGTLLLLRFARRGLLDRLTLPARLGRDEGFLARQEQEDLAGRTGIALTQFRPAGTLEVDGIRVDAVSEGNFIAAGSPVRVVRVEGTRVLVRETERRQD